MMTSKFERVIRNSDHRSHMVERSFLSVGISPDAEAAISKTGIQFKLDSFN